MSIRPTVKVHKIKKDEEVFHVSQSLITAGYFKYKLKLLRCITN